MGKVDVNFYKVWTGISLSAKVIISDINRIIYVGAVMRVTIVLYFCL